MVSDETSERVEGKEIKPDRPLFHFNLSSMMRQSHVDKILSKNIERKGQLYERKDSIGDLRRYYRVEVDLHHRKLRHLQTTKITSPIFKNTHLESQ